jgi:hypothetical protein
MVAGLNVLETAERRSQCSGDSSVVGLNYLETTCLQNLETSCHKLLETNKIACLKLLETNELKLSQ